MKEQKPVMELSDEELFDELREQVNRSRYDGMHDRLRTRAIADEMDRRGWKRKRPDDYSSGEESGE